MTYADLPDIIRALYTPEQFAWLPDADKERLVQTETEPEEE